jgi:D-3-phosphoglycerate dehydrogenase
MRILVADELGQAGLTILEEGGEVTVKTGMDEATLRATLPGYHALIVRSATKATGPSLEGATDLVVIGRAGIGIDNIDVAAATERGIVVMNTPLTAAVTTAEHAVSLMMSLARNIPAADASMKAGRWDKKLFVGTELRGKTLGVLGLGKIGSVVADRGCGLKMEVIAYDPQVSQGQAPEGVRMVSFDELLANADFLTLHLPLMDATRGLLDADAFAKMKDGARLIHAARGGIVKEAALIAALESGKLAGAALDVFENEPLAEDSPLRSMPNVVLTPHLGASTAEAKRNVSIDMARQIVACLNEGIVLNGINAPRIAPEDAPQVAPWLSLTRNLSRLLLSIFDGELEALRLTLQGSIPRMAPDALQAEMIAGALGTRTDRPVTSVNAAHIAEELGVRITQDAASIKRDFVNVVRVEALIGGERHRISGTVLGSRHGRMIDLDDYLLDAIPEGPLLFTFNENAPGVIAGVSAILGESQVNVDRLQVGALNGTPGPAIGIWNLSTPLPEALRAKIAKMPNVSEARAID